MKGGAERRGGVEGVGEEKRRGVSGCGSYKPEEDAERNGGEAVSSRRSNEAQSRPRERDEHDS